MVRRTISVAPAIDDTIRRIAEEEGSYSAAVARLVEEGARRMRKNQRPTFIGSFVDPALPKDFAREHEHYLEEAIRRIGRHR